MEGLEVLEIYGDCLGNGLGLSWHRNIKNSHFRYSELENCHNPCKSQKLCVAPRFLSSSVQMEDARRPLAVPIPALEKADKSELLRALETSLGSPFSVDPIHPNPSPMII
ncbi:hypothetical protein CRG98_010853, partial [Punica granatum]